jgi:hypothetical protein
MVALSWVLVLPNSQLLPVKIDLLQLLPQRWPLCAMPQENQRSSIAVKAISASALP